ncbi:hypothetical protein RCL1_006021 [Eukaryota sp. TZLM3-RCL]
MPLTVDEAIDFRRSCRSYKPEDLSDEIVDQIIEAGLKAPTAMNRQQVRFVVVKNQELLNEISHIAVSSFPDQYQMYKDRFAEKSIFMGAPVVVFLWADHGCPGWEIGDSSIAAGQMLVKAASLEIGSCVVGLSVMGTEESKEQIKAKLQIPPEGQLVVSLIFGHIEAVGKAPRIKEGRVVKL